MHNTLWLTHSTAWYFDRMSFGEEISYLLMQRHYIEFPAHFLCNPFATLRLRCNECNNVYHEGKISLREYAHWLRRKESNEIYDIHDIYIDEPKLEVVVSEAECPVCSERIYKESQRQLQSTLEQLFYEWVTSCSM